jgi:hypothetical protein
VQSHHSAFPPERLATLIPERARQAGVADLEGYLDFLDREATGHLSKAPSQRRKRRPFLVLDERGEAVFLVPHGGAATAMLDAGDWLSLQEGGANGLWGLPSGRPPKVRTYRAMSGRGRKYVYVGRLILGLGVGERVRFLNGNPLDLRRFNLKAERCGDLRLGNARGPIRRGNARRWKARLEGKRL